MLKENLNHTSHFAHHTSNKGITLIALIITIIVMLILVAVTISMAINGGLFEKVGQASQETQNAIDQEKEIANGGVNVDGAWYNSVNDYIDELNKDESIAITSIANIGDYVNYRVDYDNDGDTKDDWRVFYNDGTNIYLISSFYVSNVEGLTFTNHNTIDWAANGFTTAESVLSFLENEEFWNSKLGNSLAEYVHGGLSKTMFEASYNEKYPEGGGKEDVLYNMASAPNGIGYVGIWLASIGKVGNLQRVVDGEVAPDANSSDLTNLTGELMSYGNGSRMLRN